MGTRQWRGASESRWKSAIGAPRGQDKDRVVAKFRQCCVWRRARRSDCSSGYPRGFAQSLEARGRYKSARRLRSTIGSVFRYAIATARAETDPTYSLRGALAQVKSTPLQQLLTRRGLEPCSAPSTHSTGSPARGSSCNYSRCCFRDRVNCGWLSGQSSTSSERYGPSQHRA